MEGHCEKHVFEPTEALCRACGGEFCGDCLVYAYGPKKPPYCVNCALAAAGVRSTAARPQTRSRRDVRRELKEQKRMAKASAKATDADLFAATPLSSSRPVVELEFTINDDGTVDRPGTDVIDEAEAVESEDAAAGRHVSLFDQPVEQAS